ncbi:MAG: flagellar biosynthesis protein FlhA [Burkholderiales bacterium]|jgi:flagellar biosynthesis protein FlhA
MNPRLALNWLPFPLPSAKVLGVPVLIMILLSMLVLPLPPFLLDVLFTFNIAVSLVVLMVASYNVKPLQFSSFPTVLLLTTMLRLGLSVASTRAILQHGHTGTEAAGKVIESFANFLIGGNFAVGLIVFLILTVINFMVVTKGAGRIAEVSARFALDAMPGKQMAIDADLSAGLIDEKEARRRRLEVGQEADFFGSMDGASKFVRGDAIAAMIILGVNIVGGLAIGLMQHNMPLDRALSNYTLLAVGDALVAQIPSLIISLAAGLIVSRVGDDEDIGGQVTSQLFTMPRALGLTAGVMALLGIIPGMPHLAFLGLAAACGWAAHWLTRKQAEQAAAPPTEQAPAAAPSNEASWDDVAPVDALSLEVGYRLIPLLEGNEASDLLSRIKGVRKKFAAEVGFLPPAVHIKDNLELRPNGYRILLKGAVIGEGEVFPERLMAINPGHALLAVPGTPAQDPAYGLPALWIDTPVRDEAQSNGYTVVDAATVIATHLNHLMGLHAARLLGRAESQQLLDHIGRFAGKLAEDVVPKQLSLPIFQKVLQNLLDEAVHVRDLRTILESLAEQSLRTQDAAELTREVRIALSPAIVDAIYGAARELDVIAFDPNLENLLLQALAPGSAGALEPGVADLVVKAAADAANRQESAGVPACLLVPDRIRVSVARLLKKAAPRLRVLAHAEIPDTHAIRIGRIIGDAS